MPIQLPLEINAAIAGHLEDDIFRVRDFHIPPLDFRSDHILHDAISRQETHLPVDSIRKRLKDSKQPVDKDELEERHSLYLQHRRGYPCKQISATRLCDYFANLQSFVHRHTTFACTSHSRSSSSPGEECINVQTPAGMKQISGVGRLALTDANLVVVQRNKLYTILIDQLEQFNELEDFKYTQLEGDVLSLATYEEHIAVLMRDGDGVYVHVDGTTFRTAPYKSTQHCIALTQDRIFHVFQHDQHELRFEWYSMTGQLLEEWSHPIELPFDDPPPYTPAKLVHTGDAWLFTLGYHGPPLNILIEEHRKITVLPDWLLKVWKGKIYHVSKGLITVYKKEGIIKNSRVSRTTTDWLLPKKIGVLSWSDDDIGGRESEYRFYHVDCRINDTYMVTLVVNQTQWRKYVLTFDAGLEGEVIGEEPVPGHYHWRETKEDQLAEETLSGVQQQRVTLGLQP